MSLKAISRAILSYRLKYNIERQYPGRWTTPVVLIVFAVVTAFLALLNISLAGQDIVQEFTAYPNDTSSDLPFSVFLPSLLRPSPGDFTPATFKVGETLRTNMSLFEYEIVEAFDDNGRQIPAFPWYNNPLSSCDVGEIHMSLPWTESSWAPQLSALIACWFPSNITLIVSLRDIENELFKIKYSPWPLEFLRQLFVGTEKILDDKLAGPNKTIIVGEGTEPHLQYVDLRLENTGTWHYKSIAHPACDNEVAAIHFPVNDLPPFCEAVVQNTIQSFYHLLRLDLGVIMPNQIFTFPEIFNKTMQTRPVQEWIDSNSSSSIQWQSFWATPTLPPVPLHIQGATLDVAVPKAVYLQPRFRPKPLPSAITSVFVATITMVTTIWKMFSLIAGFFVDSTLDDTERTRKVEMMEEEDGSGVELLRVTRRGTV